MSGSARAGALPLARVGGATLALLEHSGEPEFAEFRSAAARFGGATR